MCVDLFVCSLQSLYCTKACTAWVLDEYIEMLKAYELRARTTRHVTEEALLADYELPLLLGRVGRK